MIAKFPYPSARLPWLALLVGALLLAYPLVRLAPLVRMQLGLLGAARPSYSAGFGSPTELGRSQRFRVLAPRAYIADDEVTALLQRAEERRTRLMAELGLPDDDRQVTITLRPEIGVPIGTGRTVVLFAYQLGRGDFVHELTHVLTGYNSAFLAEGLAVRMEQRLGWGLAFATFGRPLSAHVNAALRSGELPAVANILRRKSLWDPGDVSASKLRYAVAGSFTGYLIDTYGLPVWLALYRNANVRMDFEGTYGRSLAALEQEWRAVLGRTAALQAAWLIVLGAAAAAVIYLGAKCGGVWLGAAAVAALAHAAWSFYLVWGWAALAAPAAWLLAVFLLRLLNRTAASRAS